MKRRMFFRLCIIALLTFVSGGQVLAQTDITKYFLSNYGFDEDFDYPASSSATVSQEILPIPGWTAHLSADYTITGIYEFGFKGRFNGAAVPAAGIDGETGGALALSTGWEQSFCYYQTVTLPAGTYTFTAATYNGKTATGGSSQLAWLPSGGIGIKSSLSGYPARQWTKDQITFTLSRQTTGKLQIGYKAAAGGSGSSANLLIDYVRLVGENMTVNKTKLTASITTANTLYGSGDGIGAAALKEALDAAHGVADDEAATMPQVLEANYNLQEAIAVYNDQNASEEHPADRTSLIQNPSFESNGTSGWDISGMSTQTNTVFYQKKGTYYVEAWVNIGQQIGNVSVRQKLTKLPKGNYRLLANAVHVQQAGSNSLVNKGSAQTGAFLFAGTARTEITSVKQYAVSFAVIEEKGDVEIGLMTENATGNYLCVDNFILQYTGSLTDASYAQELQRLVDQGKALKEKGVQLFVAEKLQLAIGMAEAALLGIGTDEQGQTKYDAESLDNGRNVLLEALEAAKSSRSLYEALQARVDYAETVAGWWKDTERKATALANLTTAIETAKEQLTDYQLTDNQLTQAVTTLNTRISAVDKKIYCSTNACGTDAALKNPNSQWCYDRSLQSKHWILFWEAGYGNAAPAVVPGILNTADRIFEFYADSLKYIAINQGKSKTDTYKMIIRLRFTTDWEASGSGIDDQIGMLTLSNGAHTSRSGQTVAHEIGHCFQYQTHCDNGNWNGWMYNWGNSTLNVFWEMCAQWQAYKFYPDMQFNNEWLTNTLNGLHRHPLSIGLRYNNYFIQDYFCHKHGMDFLGRMWNESRNPEDPLQTYMRLTMTGTSTQKLEHLNDEMWEYGARLTTFDMDPIRTKGKATINKRSQPAFVSAGDGFWSPTAAYCIENFGNNAIRLNVPTADKTIYAELVGQAGKAGYTSYNKAMAGWRVGFVALQRDGTRLYGDIGRASYTDSVAVVAFDCPANCTYVWLVVSGAPSRYWTRDWLSWDAESTAEQWPYRVKLYQTNIYGKANNNTLPDWVDGIETVKAGTVRPADNRVYSVTGVMVREGSTSLEGLPSGIYLVGGKKVMKQ